jgi:hypothetical protein
MYQDDLDGMTAINRLASGHADADTLSVCMTAAPYAYSEARLLCIGDYFVILLL